MEYDLEKNCVGQLGCVLDSVAEKPVDIDLTLPDYCPDIERILCCKLIPKVYVTDIGSDRLNIEGGSCVRIIYIDSDRGCLRSYEYSQPFSESMTLSERPDNCAVFIDPKPEYINCRALSPRKLSLHGAFSLRARVAVRTELCCFTYNGSGDLQVRKEKIGASDLRGLCTEDFSVQEEIPAGVKTEISSLLSHRLTAKITELKAIHNKIMLNAELKLEALYLSGVENCQAECMSYSLPVSRVIDCDGVDDSSVIDGRLSVMSEELRLGGDALDGSALLSLEAKLSFSALCYSDKEIEVISDAFSVDREEELRFVPFSCACGMRRESFTDIGKANISVDDSISRVIDVHCERLTVSPVTKDDSVTLAAKMRISLMYENAENEIRCAERDAEFTCLPDTGGADCVESLHSGLDSLSYRLSDAHTVELRAELCCSMTLCSRKSCSAVASVTASDDAPARTEGSALILYYTDSGDNVWEISKRFRSRPADIISENELDGDTVDGGMMLLIPTA